MRRYWKDTRIIEYSLVLQPFIDVDHNISGVSFGNGFIGKYNKPDSIVQGYRQFVIAHEMGHYYLGDVVAFSGEDMEGQWFDEGFNDYTTIANLTGAGYFTPNDFEREFNRIFLQLYGSQIKNTANNKIFENFWKLGDFQKLPYWRGCVYAFYLDNQISLASGHQFSIRDLMLDLKQLVSTRKNKMFTNEEFINSVSKFLTFQQVQDAFRKYIEEGSSINFNNSMLMPYFRIENSSGIPVIHIVDKAKFLSHYKLN
jgi:predicted metalloprotease with PDZ domain